MAPNKINARKQIDDAVNAIMEPMEEPGEVQSFDLFESRHIYAQHLRDRGARPETFLELAAAAGGRSPRSVGFLRQVALLPGAPRHMPLEIPSPKGTDADLCRSVAEAAVLLAQSMLSKADADTLTSEERLQALYKAAKLADNIYGPNAAQAHGTRKKLLQALIALERFEDAREEFSRLVEHDGSLAAADIGIANASPRMFAVAELESDPDAAKANADLAIVCLTFARDVADAPSKKAIDTRLRELRAATGRSVVPTQTSADLDAEWQQRIEAVIEALSGPFAEEYRDEAQQRVRIAQNGSLENAKMARTWLDDFCKLVACQASPSAPAQDLATRLAKLDAALDTVYGHGEAKRTVRAHASLFFDGIAKTKMLAIEGPPGNGKTSLAKAIGSALAPAVVTINFGGLHDVDAFMGERSLYIGARPSPIARAIMEQGTQEVAVILDELDKAPPKLQNAVGTMLEFKDPFIDGYFGRPLDLSKVYFIALMNTRTTNRDDGVEVQEPALIVPHLRNRLSKIIRTGPLSDDDKLRVVTQQASKAFADVNYPGNLSEAALRYIVQRNKQDTGGRGTLNDVEQLAAIARLRTRAGDAPHEIKLADAMLQLGERSLVVQGRDNFTKVDVSSVVQPNMLQTQPASFTFQSGSRTWRLDLALDGGTLTLTEGNPTAVSLELTLGNENAAYFFQPAQSFKVDETFAWAWGTSDIMQRLRVPGGADLRLEPNESLIGCSLRIGIARSSHWPNR